MSRPVPFQLVPADCKVHLWKICESIRYLANFAATLTADMRICLQPKVLLRLQGVASSSKFSPTLRVCDAFAGNMPLCLQLKFDMSRPVLAMFCICA